MAKYSQLIQHDSSVVQLRPETNSWRIPTVTIPSKNPQLNSKVIFFSKTISTGCVFCNPSSVYKPTPIHTTAQWPHWGQKPILEDFRLSQFLQKKAAEFKDNFLSKIISTSCVFCSPSRVYKPTPIQHDGSVASLRPETHSRLAFKWISVWVFQIDYSITFTVSLQKVRQFFI